MAKSVKSKIAAMKRQIASLKSAGDVEQNLWRWTEKAYETELKAQAMYAAASHRDSDRLVEAIALYEQAADHYVQAFRIAKQHGRTAHMKNLLEAAAANQRDATNVLRECYDIGVDV